MRSFISNWLLLLLGRRSIVRCRVRAVDALLWLRFSADVSKAVGSIDDAHPLVVISSRCRM